MSRITSWPALLTPRELHADCCCGGSCPPYHSQRRGPTVVRGSPPGPLKPGEGRGCPVLLTWGEQAQSSTSHRASRADEQWAGEGWLQRWPAGSQARGYLGVRACPLQSKQQVLQRAGSGWGSCPDKDPGCQGRGAEGLLQCASLSQVVQRASWSRFQEPLLSSKDPLMYTLLSVWAKEPTSSALPSFQSLDGVAPPRC